MPPLAAAVHFIHGDAAEQLGLVGLLQAGHQQLALGNLLRGNIHQLEGGLWVGDSRQDCFCMFLKRRDSQFMDTGNKLKTSHFETVTISIRGSYDMSKVAPDQELYLPHQQGRLQPQFSDCFFKIYVFTLLLEAFSMAADTLMDCRYRTWSSIRDTRGVTTSVTPNQPAHMRDVTIQQRPSVRRASVHLWSREPAAGNKGFFLFLWA